MVQIEAEVDDSEKHERVAKALEQINGLRYRYKGTGAKPEKKDINVDSDGDGSEDDTCDDRADAKPSSQRRASAQRRASQQQQQQQQQRERADRLLTLDEHIERMLLRTRTVALLKIATNTAEVLPDEDEEEEDDEFFDEADEYEDDDDGYDDRHRGGSLSGQGGDDLDGDESVDRFDSLGATGGTLSHVSSSHSSSMQRMGSMRRPTSFRTASFRSSNGAPADPEAAAALRLVRKLSTFLNLPKVISYRDLEEITESLLDEPHDESDEYAHLIDEHVDSARDSAGGDSSVATSDPHNASTRSLGARHLATQKSLRELNINDDPEDLELQQRRLFIENAGLRRYSSKKLIGASSHNLLRGASKQSLHGSPGASTRDMLVHKESKRSLTHGESWRSGGGGGGPGSITSLMEESDEKDDDDGGDAFGGASGSGELGDGVFGTTFDEHGYKQWRTEVKDDYLAWIRAKLEAKKQRRLQKQKDADKKPRWQLLYEAASKGRPSSAAEDQAKAEPRKGSVVKRPARQSIA